MGATEAEEIKTQLKKLLVSIEASGRAVLPRTNDELLRSIVEAAARIFGAAGASIALVNERDHTLEFKVSFNAGDFDVVGMTIPIDKGIAGYVAMTGQPLSVSDVHQDPRFDRKFAESTGYVPDSILATPLFSGDRVIGVMEVLDKLDAPSFGLQDMELLGMFANQAALAIDQSQQYDILIEALVAGLKRIAQDEDQSEVLRESQTEEEKQPSILMDALDDVMENLRSGEMMEGNDLLVLADVFNEISEMGSAEQNACLQILRVFIEYQHSKPRYLR